MKISHNSKITASVDTGLLYWYKFKHGLGPGTMPKGVNVMKVIEDGWKDYVLLDKMLTTEELNQYEIKEETPPQSLLEAAGYDSIEDTYKEFNSCGTIEGASEVNLIPEPFDKYYQIDDSVTDESIAETLDGYEAKHLAWVVARDEYFDSLSNNGIEYAELVTEGDSDPFLAYVVDDRLYPVTTEDLEMSGIFDDDEFEDIEESSDILSSESIEASYDDDYTMSANTSRYYVTPDISEDDLEFAAESAASYLKRRNLDQITTEDVIDELRSMSEMWDEYWAYGLRTKEAEKSFLDDFLARLAKYGITDVVDNTFSEVTSSEKIEGSWDNPNIFDFYGWYNNLTLKQKHQVDDWCDEWGYPLYDDCSREELSAIHDHFESEFSQANETNFHVAAFGNDFDELQNSIDTDDPKKAIQTWLNWQGKYPTDVMITGYAKGEQILRDYVTNHQDWFRAASAKSKSPYDPEYIIDECAKPSRMKPSEYTDQLHPFGLG